MPDDDEGYDFVGALDPVELFKDSNELVKSKLNSVQCSSLAASSALAEYHRDPSVGVMAVFRQAIRLYSRANDGYATEQYVKVLNRRVDVQDRNPEATEMM